jgi:putative two-component system response regulator
VDTLVTAQPDILLLDVMMPGVSGLGILDKVRADERFVDLPIVMVTAATDSETKLKALKLGATDFLTKPVDPAELVTRVRNVLKAKAYQDALKRRAWELELERPMLNTELRGLQEELVFAVARAVESRGRGGDEHAVRVGRYAKLVAAQLELGQAFVDMIEHAAALHDIGKIALSESVFSLCSKFGHSRLEPELGNRENSSARADAIPEELQREYRAHTEIGARVLSSTKSPLLRMAARIALTHHERWDGKGYPLGIAGPRIPIEGRITAVADAFDSLCDGNSSRASHRLDDYFGMLEQHKGTRFDPDIVDAFSSCGQGLSSVQRAESHSRL